MMNSSNNANEFEEETLQESQKVENRDEEQFINSDSAEENKSAIEDQDHSIEAISESITDDIPVDPAPYPTFSLHRNADLSREYETFIPGDLITLIVNGTGDWKSSSVHMIDSRDQVRYQAFSGGNNHNWTTRIQQTKTFGDWRFQVLGPLTRQNDEFDQVIPFELVRFLPEQLEVEVAPPVVTEGDPVLSYIPVVEVVGIGPTYATRLNDAGIVNLNDMFAIDSLRAAEITNGTPTKAERWFEFIEEVRDTPNHELRRKYQLEAGIEVDFVPLLSSDDPPEKIKGIGPATADKLRAFGLSSVEDIANSSPETISSGIKVTIKKAINWVSDAQLNLTGTSDIKVLEKKPVKEIPTIKPDDSVTIIKGIGPATARKLEAAGYNTLKSVVDAIPDEIAESLSISLSKATAWVADAQMKLTGETKVEEPKVKKAVAVSVSDPLRRIRGVGPTYNKRLIQNGIESLNQFVALDVDEIAAIAKIPVSKAKQWLTDARKLIETDT
ncbi:MAG: helix-hairpin-helix domain-containing protein [Candidatus Kariarchaeaceae archaeon]|jgi:predicted flap endonuclease-1-like 5' DNA nuclease